MREKLGLSAASNAILAAVSSSSEPPDPTSSVLHRVLEIEDKRQEPEPDLTPLPQALVHSLSGSWKPLVLDSGKPAWQRDERTSNEVQICMHSACEMFQHT